MLHTTARTFRAPEIQLPDSVQQLWRTLQAADGHLPDLDQFGAGEVTGGHLRVRFVRDSEDQLFACEVTDLIHARWWEAGFARLAEGNWRTFWRGLSGEEYPPAPWTAAVSGLRLEAAEPQLQPTFMCVAAAHAAAGGLSLAENTMIRASLDDDLGYWRELARAQARVIERLNERIPFATRPRSHDVLAAASPESQPTRVWKLNELAEWAALSSGRIVILPRAIAAARKSTFDDPAVVFAALEVLAGSFREVKARSAPRDKAKQELDALGIDIGGSVDPAHADDGYFVRWRGRRRFLDQHLKKGTSRDPRYSMRIYYTWDDELHMCVVGWLPGHLSNSLT